MVGEEVKESNSRYHPPMCKSMQTNRREALKQGMATAAAAAVPALFSPSAQAYNRRAFETKAIQEAVRALGGGALVENKGVSIEGPEIAENGASVPVSLATTLPGVRSLALLVEKNPGVLAAVFQVTEAIEPAFSLRIKMAQSSDVYAVAIAQDGRAFYARREIKVTLGGCG
jgi:sulfur-oxidizing protein SoxY